LLKYRKTACIAPRNALTIWCCTDMVSCYYVYDAPTCRHI